NQVTRETAHTPAETPPESTPQQPVSQLEKKLFTAILSELASGAAGSPSVDEQRNAASRGSHPQPQLVGQAHQLLPYFHPVLRSILTKLIQHAASGVPADCATLLAERANL